MVEFVQNTEPLIVAAAVVVAAAAAAAAERLVLSSLTAERIEHYSFVYLVPCLVLLDFETAAVRHRLGLAGC